ncbi:terminase small subunit [Clostridium senegalense]|uniref:terminase small subunit n=1 Tax=Clostridium senegalense TaxID=1465809 RepID=UPI001C122CED|nr:terminase small subunit [Clostridium senegalense]MBU5227840.1 terminase small subunit [Clostridium senegalense]
MADIRGPDIKELAEKDYMSGMKYKDIAEKYNVSLNTVKSWKQRYKWSREGVHTNEKVCTQNKKNAKSKVNNKKKEPIAEEVKEVLENTELTDKQRLFCVLYVKCMNATKAYLKAYTCTYESAMVNGSRLLGNDKIREQIDKLIGAKCNKEFLSRSVIQKYIDIAFADITDYVTFGLEEFAIRDENGNIQYDEEGNIRTRKYSYVKPNESIRVDGTLISEVSQGKDGIKFKLADKMKALDFLTKHCNLLSDEEKIKLDIENKKLQNIKLKAETEKIKGKDKDETIEIVIKRKGDN